MQDPAMTIGVRALLIGVVSVLAASCGQHDEGVDCSTRLYGSPQPQGVPVCLDRPFSTLPDGAMAGCRAFAVSQRATCDCATAGRTPARQAGCSLRLANADDTAAMEYPCSCELVQLSGPALAECLNDESTTSDGWCYATNKPVCGPQASDEVASACASGYRVKVQGGASLATDETLLLACNGTAIVCPS